MAFHPYPQVIRKLFNAYRFGPPVCVTKMCIRDRPYSQGQQGNRPPYNRQGGAPQGERRPYGGQGQQGNRPPFRQGGAGPQRPGGFNRPAPRAAIETPAVEKERVSNYDPNKSNYNRNYDNDRKAKPRKGIVEKGAVMRDDERVRGRRKPKKQAPAHVIEPIKIEHAVITTEMVPIKTLAEKIGKPAGDIIKKLFLIGKMCIRDSHRCAARG